MTFFSISDHSKRSLLLVVFLQQSGEHSSPLHCLYHEIFQPIPCKLQHGHLRLHCDLEIAHRCFSSKQLSGPSSRATALFHARHAMKLNGVQNMVSLSLLSSRRYYLETVDRRECFLITLMLKIF